MRAQRKPLKVEIPSAEQEALRLGRVGIIAAVGFAIGVVWPWLAQVRLVPEVPESERPKKVAATVPTATKSTSRKQGALPAAAEPPPVDPSLRLELGETQVTSCRTAEGHSISDCDAIDVLPVFEKRFLALAGCSGTQSVTGTLSVGFDLNFEKNEVSELQSGRSTTLSDTDTEKLLACLERELATVSLSELKHEHASYTVFHLIEFEPPKQAGAADTEQEVIAASGRATVNWHVALVRESPKDGKVQERLLSGTRVYVTGRSGDWYRIKYDSKGSEGWVFKSAIGL